MMLVMLNLMSWSLLAKWSGWAGGRPVLSVPGCPSSLPQDGGRVIHPERVGHTRTLEQTDGTIESATLTWLAKGSIVVLLRSSTDGSRFARTDAVVPRCWNAEATDPLY